MWAIRQPIRRRDRLADRSTRQKKVTYTVIEVTTKHAFMWANRKYSCTGWLGVQGRTVLVQSEYTNAYARFQSARRLPESSLYSARTPIVTCGVDKLPYANSFTWCFVTSHPFTYRVARALYSHYNWQTYILAYVQSCTCSAWLSRGS